MINNNVLDMIGNTPMIKLNNIGNSNLYVKLVYIILCFFDYFTKPF